MDVDANDTRDAAYWVNRCEDIYNWNFNVAQIARDLIDNYGVKDTGDPIFHAFDDGFHTVFGSMDNCDNAIEVVGQIIEEFA